MIPRTPISTLFPYTTLFRSQRRAGLGGVEIVVQRRPERGLELGGQLREPPFPPPPSPFPHPPRPGADPKSTRLNSSHPINSDAAFSAQKKTTSSFINPSIS